MLDINSEYFAYYLYYILKKSNHHIDDNQIFVSEVTYCARRYDRFFSFSTNMLDGIERELGLCSIANKLFCNKGDEVAKLSVQGKFDEVKEILKQCLGFVPSYVIVCSPSSYVVSKEFDVFNQKIKLAGSPDALLVVLKPLKITVNTVNGTKTYEIPPSINPIEKKTGAIKLHINDVNKLNNIRRFSDYAKKKYVIALSQLAVYSYLMNSPIAILQSDESLKYPILGIRNEYVTVSHEIFLFKPFFDDEAKSLFEINLLKRIELAIKNRKRNNEELRRLRESLTSKIESCSANSVAECIRKSIQEVAREFNDESIYQELIPSLLNEEENWYDECKKYPLHTFLARLNIKSDIPIPYLEALRDKPRPTLFHFISEYRNKKQSKKQKEKKKSIDLRKIKEIIEDEYGIPWSPTYKKIVDKAISEGKTSEEEIVKEILKVF